jgi:hypothetical protein
MRLQKRLSRGFIADGDGARRRRNEDAVAVHSRTRADSYVTSAHVQRMPALYAAALRASTVSKQSEWTASGGLSYVLQMVPEPTPDELRDAVVDRASR